MRGHREAPPWRQLVGAALDVLVTLIVLWLCVHVIIVAGPVRAAWGALVLASLALVAGSVSAGMAVANRRHLAALHQATALAYTAQAQLDSVAGQLAVAQEALYAATRTLTASTAALTASTEQLRQATRTFAGHRDAVRADLAGLAGLEDMLTGESADPREGT